jgi:hypothetical protein
VPKVLKRTTGRAQAAQVPAHISAFGVTLDRDARAVIRQQLGAKLGKYASAIERVSVRISDVNGPRGGVDKACRIKVVLIGLPSIVFESQARSVNDAVNGALAGTERTVRRGVQRRHTKPRKAAARGNGRRRPDVQSDQEL